MIIPCDNDFPILERYPLTEGKKKEKKKSVFVHNVLRFNKNGCHINARGDLLLDCKESQVNELAV